MSTIYILWLRQVKKYLRSRSRLLGSLGQPLLFLLVFGFGFGRVFQRAGEGNYLNFLAPGIIMMSVLFTAIFSGIELIWDRQFGFLKETMAAPVTRFAIMAGRTLGGASVATIQGLIVFILTLLVGFRPQNWLLLPVGLVFIFLVALLFTALGTAIASVLEDMQGFQVIMNFLVMPIFFLSGSLFPIDDMPAVMKTVAKFDPLSYGIDGLRQVLIGVNQFHPAVDFLILGSVTLVLLALGSYLFNKIQI